jgi:hypothetical protein
MFVDWCLTNYEPINKVTKIFMRINCPPETEGMCTG